jgi:hypothetical protein
MAQLAARQPFQQREETPMHGVNQIALAAFYDARGPAAWASGVRSKVKLIGERRILRNSTSGTLKRGRVVELLKESPVHALQGLPALGACIHWESL